MELTLGDRTWQPLDLRRDGADQKLGTWEAIRSALLGGGGCNHADSNPTIKTTIKLTGTVLLHPKTTSSNAGNSRNTLSGKKKCKLNSHYIIFFILIINVKFYLRLSQIHVWKICEKNVEFQKMCILNYKIVVIWNKFQINYLYQIRWHGNRVCHLLMIIFYI